MLIWAVSEISKFNNNFLLSVCYALQIIGWLDNCMNNREYTCSSALTLIVCDLIQNIGIGALLKWGLPCLSVWGTGCRPSRRRCWQISSCMLNNHPLFFLLECPSTLQTIHTWPSSTRSCKIYLENEQEMVIILVWMYCNCCVVRIWNHVASQSHITEYL